GGRGLGEGGGRAGGAGADERADRLRIRRPVRSRAVCRRGGSVMSTPMSVDVVTFGCRLNAYEAEVIRRQAQAAGLADTVVVNTCAVTAEAVREARPAIRPATRERPCVDIVG